MENQNSEPQEKQEKKKFFASLSRKKKTVIAVLVVLVLIGTIGRGFAFGAARGYRGFHSGIPSMGTGNVALVVKDFEPLGIVFAEAAGASGNGYRAAYDALIKEAAKKGADAIINVNISSSGLFFNRTWSGSALAVKYLDSVLEGYSGIQQGLPAETALMMRGGRWFGR